MHSNFNLFLCVFRHIRQWHVGSIEEFWKDISIEAFLILIVRLDIHNFHVVWIGAACIVLTTRARALGLRLGLTLLRLNDWFLSFLGFLLNYIGIAGVQGIILLLLFILRWRCLIILCFPSLFFSWLFLNCIGGSLAGARQDISFILTDLLVAFAIMLPGFHAIKTGLLLVLVFTCHGSIFTYDLHTTSCRMQTQLLLKCLDRVFPLKLALNGQIIIAIIVIFIVLIVANFLFILLVFTLLFIHLIFALLSVIHLFVLGLRSLAKLSFVFFSSTWCIFRSCFCFCRFCRLFAPFRIGFDIFNFCCFSGGLRYNFVIWFAACISSILFDFLLFNFGFFISFVLSRPIILSGGDRDFSGSARWCNFLFILNNLRHNLVVIASFFCHFFISGSFFRLRHEWLFL